MLAGIINNLSIRYDVLSYIYSCLHHLLRIDSKRTRISIIGVPQNCISTVTEALL